MMRMAVSLAVCAAFLSCNATLERAAGPATPLETLAQSPNGNFALCVSNQSRDIRSVDIRVLIDGKLAMNDVFKARRLRKSRTGDSLSNMRTYTFALAPGVHTLEAYSRKGKAEAKTQFATFEKNWATIDYWFARKDPGAPGAVERALSCRVTDQPIAFQ